MVSPASLTLNPGQTASFTVTFTNASATPGNYVGGQLTWAGGGVSVRSPIVVRPVALAAPTQVSGSYNVTFGYNGPFTATARGLVAATVTPGAVSDDPTDGACSLTAPNAVLVPVTVPAGTTYARFSLFDADVSAGADLDMCVFNSADTLVGQQRQRHVRGGSKPSEPGSRQLHRRCPGMGRRRLEPLQPPHLAAGFGRRWQHDGLGPDDRRGRQRRARSTWASAA